MRTTDINMRAAPVAGEAAPPGLRRSNASEYATALLFSVLTFAALGILYLFPFVTRHYRYPLGWDAPAYVGRVNVVSAHGLSEFGAIRSANSLLLSVLGRATGANRFTLVALLPALWAGASGLAAAAMVRIAVGSRAMWLPVIGFLAWVAFGQNSTINLHFDNLLTGVAVLAGFAAAMAFVSGGRGALAATLCFMLAGLAHWPFYVFAMGVFVLALIVYWATEARTWDGRLKAVRGSRPLIVAVLVSGAFTGLTLLAPGTSGWLGARIGRLRGQLQARFEARLRDRKRYLALPLAVGGAIATFLASRSAGTGDKTDEQMDGPDGPGKTHAGGHAMLPARRLFLALMGSWVAVMVVAGVAQAAGFPTAGARLLQFLFPIPILAGVFVWWLGRLGARRGWGGKLVAAVVVLATVVGFGSLAWHDRSRNRPWMTARQITQIDGSGAYLATIPRTQTVSYVLPSSSQGNPWWAVIQAALPAREIRRSSPYYGSAENYLAGRPSYLRPALGVVEHASPAPRTKIAIVLEAFSPGGFETQIEVHPERVVAPGVFVLRGPVRPLSPVPTGTPPQARTGLRDILAFSALAMAILYVAGAGWSGSLLPPDPVVRVALAPALGMATITLTAFAWDRVGLPFGGVAKLAILIIATVGGWLVRTIRP